MKGGLATEVVVAQALTQLETTRAQLVDVNEARSEYEHAIATLINKEARDVSLAPAPLDLALPKIPVGVPSQLIERRPDIAAAERRTAAANEQIGIAISAFYPNVVLGGGGGFESTNIGTLIQGPSALWSLGSAGDRSCFSMPASGARLPIRRGTTTRRRRRPIAPRCSVLSMRSKTGCRTCACSNEESTTEQRAVAAAQHSLDLSNQRYKGGATTYLEVLVADSTLLTNQRTSTDLITRQFAASVGLVRALGGGWDVTQLPH